MSHNLNSITGKRILFLAPSFFGYERKIKEKMEQLGAYVDYYNVRSINGSFEKALLKISTNIFINQTIRYYDEILKENKSKDYDYVFIIKGDMITINIIQEMKATYKNAKLYLYLWDSIKNIRNISEKFTFFDKVFSFDREDAKNNPSIIFRPLFYMDEYKAKELKKTVSNTQCDLCFCGTIHSDRYRIIKEFKSYCLEKGLQFYTFLYLQSKFIYYFYKIFKFDFMDTKSNDFDYEKMSEASISDIVIHSKAVLDIQHPKQTGLTMRTIEMIGMEKKIITTNSDIVNYDFYNPQNILVIPRKNIVIPSDFFDKEYEPLNERVYQYYSLENWILEILT